MKDRFMFSTITQVANEAGCYDESVINDIYEELYKRTDARGKAWNLGMIDKLLEKMWKNKED